MLNLFCRHFLFYSCYLWHNDGVASCTFSSFFNSNISPKIVKKVSVKYLLFAAINISKILVWISSRWANLWTKCWDLIFWLKTRSIFSQRVFLIWMTSTKLDWYIQQLNFRHSNFFWRIIEQISEFTLRVDDDMKVIDVLEWVVARTVSKWCTTNINVCILNYMLSS